jgi:RNAse (barnase) inhibitor barstar
LEEIHEASAQVFGFPDFYGKNVNALIDCWSSLRFPEDEMTNIIVAKDELVPLEVIGMAHFTKDLIAERVAHFSTKS